MEKENSGDFVLRIAHNDIYKAVANYIKNGMGITQTYIDEYLNKFLSEHLDELVIRALSYKEMNDRIDSLISNRFRMRGAYVNGKKVTSFEDYIECQLGWQLEKAIQEKIDQRIDKYLKITYQEKPVTEETKPE